jgi:hypothetical protein
MAPRVLHFSRDRIASECHEFEAAEGLPDGTSNYALTSAGGIRAGNRLKALDGSADRSIADVSVDTGMQDLQRWRTIVETYAKTALTNPNDKLVALAGLARDTTRKSPPT